MAFQMEHFGVNVPPGYSPTNPNIIRWKDGYLLNVRMVNYEVERYTIVTGDPYIITRNALVRLDKEFNVIWRKEIVDLIYRRRTPTIQGLEDIRMFVEDDEVWFFCTILTPRPQVYRCRLGHINEDPSREKIYVKEIRPMPTSNPVEKNWCPFSFNGKTCYQYKDGVFVLDGEHLQRKAFFPHLRGGYITPWRRDGEIVGYLSVSHEVGVEDGKRIYYNRFIRLDNDLELVSFSPLFKFQEKRIEYCCSVEQTHDETAFIVPYGIMDASYEVKLLGVQQLESMLIFGRHSIEKDPRVIEEIHTFEY